MPEETKKTFTPDEIFEAADDSLRYGGGVAIQLTDRVFVVDSLDDLPEGGVPEKGEFTFVGCEILSDDIDDDDGGTPFMDGCQCRKEVTVKDCKVISEKEI